MGPRQAGPVENLYIWKEGRKALGHGKKDRDATEYCTQDRDIIESSKDFKML
jgi:hypothetical protein